MSSLQVGALAPAFTLTDTAGVLHSSEAVGSSLTLALFFKTTCPTCQYAWPYYERLHTAYGDAGLRVLGISQHDPQRTRQFQKEYHTTFPHLIDDGFTVSRAYDPAFVPTAYLMDADRNIVATLESWDSQKLNELAKNIAGRLAIEPQEIVHVQDHAVSHKIG